MKVEMIRSFEMLVTTYRTAQHHNPEDHKQHFILMESGNLIIVQTALKGRAGTLCATKIKNFKFFKSTGSNVHVQLVS
jgi:hypothetical protein